MVLVLAVQGVPVIRVEGDPIERKPLTLAKIREIKRALKDTETKTVTIETSNVTRRAKPAGSGRRKTYASGAERQKAYRERRNALS